jgi:chemotaxis signal transduction protein
MKEALVFSVEEETLATPVGLVTEVLRAAWPLRLPRAPYGCLGLLDVRGQMIPLMDLAVLLGLRQPLRPERLADRLLRAHVLRITAGGLDLGLLVSQVIEVGEEAGALTDDERLSAAVLGRAAGLVKGIAVAGPLRILVLDLSGILSVGRLKLLRSRTVALTSAEPG